ncbi:MAG: 3' terminal RNA ribose 2'-O-methyltransferase Hen1 [Eubacteriaceae bacterium]|nr:3' terminal RNA ribose 2'-O-methyltransferase Hen1 [Eubacteriaceae bacterium]
MILTITYTGKDTSDLGFLLFKNPNRPQVFQLSFGKAYVFYPEVSDERTTAALMLDIDPIHLARGKPGSRDGGLFDYVNDRPYVSSSFMSTAISRVFGTAMSGRSDERQELSDCALDLSARIAMLPCRGDQEKLASVFEPLGYETSYEPFVADDAFPGWGESKYVNLVVSGKVRLRDLLKHLNVLIPVFDLQKHYWVGEDEVKKLLRLGEGWLGEHPEKAFITSRYLNRRRALASMAFEQLAEGRMEPATAREPNLNDKRLESVVEILKKSGASRVIDIGCGEGSLLALLVKDPQFASLAGVDVSLAALKRAKTKLRLEGASESMASRISLFQGSLGYKDSRFSGYDAACVIEVIEHLDPSRLAAFERVLFEYAQPGLVVLTTPNKEYNQNYGIGLRHGDHRFEWTRDEFHKWARLVAGKHGYEVSFSGIGDIEGVLGAPTQMGVFRNANRDS